MDFRVDLLTTGLPPVVPTVTVIRRRPFNDCEWLFEPKYDGFRGVYLTGVALQNLLEAGIGSPGSAVSKGERSGKGTASTRKSSSAVLGSFEAG